MFCSVCCLQSPGLNEIVRAQVALSLANMAALLQAQGEMAAAEEHMRRALSIREDALGPDHPVVRRAIPGGRKVNSPY